MQKGLNIVANPELFVWVAIGLSLFALALVIWVAARTKSLNAIDTQLRQLASNLAASRDNAEVLDRRLIQLLTQTSDDAATLRENLVEKVELVRLQLSQEMNADRNQSRDQAHELQDQLKDQWLSNSHTLEVRYQETTNEVQKSIVNNFQALGSHINELLSRHTQEINDSVEKLTRTTDSRMREIAGQVDKRLTEGFEKTNATFADIVTRLALIDEAQKKITDLSVEVVGLQKILDDKRSRGAFGEIQLANLIENFMPPASFSMQHSLPNGRIADCMLFLPEPTGAIAIDSKFPLESYR
ncbi:MAG: DNA recombination protein RmuC, partial [Pseudomonadota bacterium]